MDVMDIARLSTQMSQANLMQEIGVRVMRNAMDHAEQTGELLAEVLDTAVPPAGFDGKGLLLDVMV